MFGEFIETGFLSNFNKAVMKYFETCMLRQIK